MAVADTNLDIGTTTAAIQQLAQQAHQVRDLLMAWQDRPQMGGSWQQSLFQDSQLQAAMPDLLADCQYLQQVFQGMGTGQQGAAGTGRQVGTNQPVSQAGTLTPGTTGPPGS